MKKKYVAPVAEKIEFCYSDQVVASGGSEKCELIWVNIGPNHCATGNQYQAPYDNE